MKQNVPYNAEANHVVDFISNLTLTGEKSGQPFLLQEWQEEALRKLFGTLDEKGNRQYKKSFWFLPRKSGKTELAAALVVYMLFGIGESGQEIVSSASTRHQAGRIFKAASQMIRQDEYLSDMCLIRESKKEIEIPHKFSKYMALSADSKKSGENISYCIVDEGHEHPQQKGKELWDVLQSSFGARTNPLFLSISTAGVYNPNHFFYQEWEYAEKIRKNPQLNPNYLPVMFQADANDDWGSEAVWHKAMPGLKFGCPRIEFIREQYNEAKHLPSAENSFRRFYLNQWVNKEDAFFDLTEYNKCPNKIDLEQLKGKLFYGGYDGSSTTDITSFVLICESDGVLNILPYFWIPEHKASQRTGKLNDQVDYHKWHKEGLVRFCKGKTIDENQVRKDIGEICDGLNVEIIGVDPFQSQSIVNGLENDGFICRAVRQGFLTMNSPMKELEKRILEHKINHGDNPVLRWMAGNTVIEQDSLNNIRPTKKKSRDKIDGISALLTAMAIYLGENSELQTSGFSAF